MSAEPKRVELTEAEIDALLSVYQSPSVRKWPRLLAVVADIVTAREADAETREAAARREALLEAADWIDDAHPNVRGLLCAAMDIRGFAEVDVVDMADTIARVEALASGLQEQYEASDYSETASLGEIVKAIRAALAEPERDEEGGR